MFANTVTTKHGVARMNWFYSRNEYDSDVGMHGAMNESVCIIQQGKPIQKLIKKIHNDFSRKNN